MAYDTQLADKIRHYLVKHKIRVIQEKKMFGGLAFMINSKMCMNVTDQNLMCRFDPSLTNELSKRPGFLPMIMKGKELDGYCYVEPLGFKSKNDFEFWINLCLNYNEFAKSSKKNTKQTHAVKKSPAQLRAGNLK